MLISESGDLEKLTATVQGQGPPRAVRVHAIAMPENDELLPEIAMDTALPISGAQLTGNTPVGELA
jgi:hypothetical protein